MTERLHQGYLVYQKGDVYGAIGDVDRKVIAENRRADVVLMRCMEQLEKSQGGEIKIKQGVFTIHEPVRIGNSVKLSGSGFGTVLKLAEDNEEGIVLKAEKKEELTISDLLCQGVDSHQQSTGIVLDECGLSEIHNVYSRDFSGFGFWVRNNCFMSRLSGNFTSGNKKAGTFIDRTEWSRASRFAPNKLIGCISYGEEGNAFEFHRAVCQDIVGCVAYQMKGHGYYMYNSTSNLISGCRSFMGEKNGILIENSYEMNISSNIIGWQWGHCLELNRCTWATISSNEFIDAGGRQDPKYGIYMHGDTKGCQVSGNAIFAWWDNQILQGGIYEAKECRENQITDNTINYYKDEGVFAGGKNGRADFNLSIRDPYASPGAGEFLPKPNPEDIRLEGDIINPSKMTREFLQSIRR